MNGLLFDDIWTPTKDGDPVGLALYERHYSARRYRDGRKRRLFVGPGEKLVLVTPDRCALFVWRKFTDDSGQIGINCAVFRNEGRGVSSALIRAADVIAWRKWPDQPRHYTYVDPSAVRSTIPGYCFIRAGWRRRGWTKGGHGRRRLLILSIDHRLANA